MNIDMAPSDEQGGLLAREEETGGGAEEDALRAEEAPARRGREGEDSSCCSQNNKASSPGAAARLLLRQHPRRHGDEDASNDGAESSVESQPLHSHLRSSLGAIANLCSATLGAGILSLPYAFYLTGWVVGLIMLVLSALATVFSIQILARSSEILHSQAYETLVEQHLSPRASAVTRLCIVVFCFGCAVAYIIAVGDLFQRLGLPRIPSMVVVWAILMMPLSCQRSMKSLQCASSIGIASISTLVVCAGIQLLLDWNVTHTEAVYNVHHTLHLWPAHGLLGVLKACPIILFAFSCQVNVCAIFHELEVDRVLEDHDAEQPSGIVEEEPSDPLIEPTESPDSRKSQAFDIVTFAAVGVCATLYTSVSVVALLEFDSMTPNLLARYSNQAGIMQVAAAAVGLAVVLAFPLNVVPARTSLARTCRKPEPVDRYDHVQTPLLQENRIRIRSRHRPVSTALHATLTLLVAGGALIAAILIPDISVVFGLLGGTTTSWLGFCLPGTLGIKLLSKRWRWISWCLVTGGVVIGVVTTAVTVATMFY